MRQNIEGMQKSFGLPARKCEALHQRREPGVKSLSSHIAFGDDRSPPSTPGIRLVRFTNRASSPGFGCVLPEDESTGPGFSLTGDAIVFGVEDHWHQQRTEEERLGELAAPRLTTSFLDDPVEFAEDPPESLSTIRCASGIEPALDLRDHHRQEPGLVEESERFFRLATAEQSAELESEPLGRGSQKVLGVSVNGDRGEVGYETVVRMGNGQETAVLQKTTWVLVDEVWYRSLEESKKYR